MPELPEVETTRRGLAPWMAGGRLTAVLVRDRRLRWPVPADLPRRLAGARVLGLDRRAKYLLLRTDRGTALLHLGMSGSIRLVDPGALPGPHDHVDFCLESGRIARFNDPRRFGSLLWAGDAPERHPLLAGLGPEPLEDGFNGDYLARVSRGRRVAVKPHLMNGRIVVGVGNIYANEALFRAGIHPARAAGRVRPERLGDLAAAVKDVLAEAIRAGGTTLRDFLSGEGEPGYFSQDLKVYDRTGEACVRCGEPVRHRVLGQRSTWFCPRCQH